MLLQILAFKLRQKKPSCEAIFDVAHRSQSLLSSDIGCFMESLTKVSSKNKNQVPLVSNHGPSSSLVWLAVRDHELIGTAHKISLNKVLTASFD